MTERTYNLINSIFSSTILLNNSKTNEMSKISIDKFILFITTNKIFLNISDKDIEDFYVCYQYYIDITIRDIIREVSSNIYRTEYNILNNVFNYILKHKTLKETFYDFDMLCFIYFSYYNTIAFLIVKKLEYDKDNTKLKLQIVKLLRDDNKYIKNFIKYNKDG